MRISVAELLNFSMGVLFIAAVLTYVACLVWELSQRPRFSIRSMLIATLVVSVLLGMGAMVRG
jgi:hypothetical protein